MRKRSEQGTRNRKLFMTLMKVRLDFLFTDLFQHFGTNLVVFASRFFIYGNS